MIFRAAFSKVFNRGVPPHAFLNEMVTWAKSAPDEIFDRTPTVGNKDIYNKVKGDLGPYENLIHRKAVMLEGMRVLAGFESTWNWLEGVDTSRSSRTTKENAEAGAWQTSYNARKLHPSIRDLLARYDVNDGIEFQVKAKHNHVFAMELVARLLRVNTQHNGPLYRGAERKRTWPNRPKLWEEKESIYPWLNRDAVAEFVKALG